MAITYTWNKKKLVADFFGNVQQIKFERKGVDGSYTELANVIYVIPEDDEEHADKWTESINGALIDAVDREDSVLRILEKMKALFRSNIMFIKYISFSFS